MTKEQAWDELHQIAQELNLPFDNDEVLTQWCRRNSSVMSKDIIDEYSLSIPAKVLNAKKSV